MCVPHVLSRLHALSLNVSGCTSYEEMVQAMMAAVYVLLQTMSSATHTVEFAHHQRPLTGTGAESAGENAVQYGALATRSTKFRVFQVLAIELGATLDHTYFLCCSNVVSSQGVLTHCTFMS